MTANLWSQFIKEEGSSLQDVCCVGGVVVGVGRVVVAADQLQPVHQHPLVYVEVLRCSEPPKYLHAKWNQSAGVKR